MLDLQTMMGPMKGGLLPIFSLVMVILLSIFSSEVEGGLTSSLHGQHLLPVSTGSSAQEDDPLPDPDTFLSAFLAKFSEKAGGSDAGEDHQEDGGDLFQFRMPHIDENTDLTTVNHLVSGPGPLQVEDDTQQDAAQERSLGTVVGLFYVVDSIITGFNTLLGLLVGLLLTKKLMWISLLLLLLGGIGGVLLWDPSVLEVLMDSFGSNVGEEGVGDILIDNRVDNEDDLLSDGDARGGLGGLSMLVFGNYSGEVGNQIGFSGNSTQKNHTDYTETVGLSSNVNQTEEKTNSTQPNNLIGGVKMSNSSGYMPILHNNLLGLNKERSQHSPPSSAGIPDIKSGEENKVHNMSETISLNDVLDLIPGSFEHTHKVSDHNHGEQLGLHLRVDQEIDMSLVQNSSGSVTMNTNDTVDSSDLNENKTEETKEVDVLAEDSQSMLGLILNKLRSLASNSTLLGAKDENNITLEAFLIEDEFSHNHTQHGHNLTQNHHIHAHTHDNLNISLGDIFQDKLDNSQHSGDHQSHHQSLDVNTSDPVALNSSEHSSAGASDQSDINSNANNDENPNKSAAEAVISIPKKIPTDDDEASESEP